MDRRTFLAGLGAGAVASTLPATAGVNWMPSAEGTIKAAGQRWHTLYCQWVNDALHENGGYLKCWVDGVEVKEGDKPLAGVALCGSYVEIDGGRLDINDWEGDEDEGFRCSVRVCEADPVLG